MFQSLETMRDTLKDALGAATKGPRRLRKTIRALLKRGGPDHHIEPDLEPFPQMAYPTIDFFYWRPKGSLNFGDELGRTITELMLARKGATLFDETAARRLLTVGSIMHFAQPTRTVVWGSGRNSLVPDSEHVFEDLDVRAVRGPRTRDFLVRRGISVPEVFGDPALLLPTLCGNRFVPSRSADVVFVPNLHDYMTHVDLRNLGMQVIDPRQSWNKVISEIIKYKLVLASSLHGIIVAEAFNIPARYVRLSEREGLFKYEDYYEGTGRAMPSIARTINEGVAMGGEQPPVFDPEELIRAFPYDIWGIQP